MSSGTNDSGISPETIELLGAVRRGKTCAYVMGFSSSKVGSLFLSKKAIPAPEISAARKGGQKAVFGVVKGQGANLTFYLARSDGNTELPFDGNPEKLKQTLNNATKALNQKWAPTFLLVDENPPLDLDESLANHPLIRRFNSLQSSVVQLVDTRPELAAPVDERTRPIRKLLQDAATINSAAPLIDQFETQLKQWQSESPSGTSESTSSTKGEVRTDAELAQQLAEKLKKLKPAVDKAIDGTPTLKPELFGALAQCASLIKAKEWTGAESAIDELTKRLASLAGSRTGDDQSTSGQPTGGQPDARQQFETRRATLEPDLLAAQRAAPDRSAKLGAVWGYANDQAAASNFANALKALDRLEPAVREILAASPRTDAEKFGIQSGIVQERVRELEPFFRQRIAEISSVAVADVRDLVEALEAETDDDAADLEEGLQDYLDDLLVELEETLVESLQAGTRDAVELAIQSCQQSVTDDPLLKKLAETPQLFQVEVGVDQRLAQLFQDARNAIAKSVTVG